MNELESILIDDNIFQVIRADSGKLIVFVNTPKFTLIPSDYYCPDMRDQYFNYIHEVSNEELIIENKLPDGNYYILFAVSQKFKYSIEKHFPLAEFYHYSTALSSRLKEDDIPDTPCVLIYKEYDQFYFLISRNKEVIYINSYQIKHENDINYFILNGLRENHLNPVNTCLFYAGESSSENEFPAFLKKYFKIIKKLPSSSLKNHKNKLHVYFRFNLNITS